MTKPVAAVVAAIPEDAWTRLEDYPDTGEAQIGASYEQHCDTHEPRPSCPAAGWSCAASA